MFYLFNLLDIIRLHPVLLPSLSRNMREINMEEMSLVCLRPSNSVHHTSYFIYHQSGASEALLLNTIFLTGHEHGNGRSAKVALASLLKHPAPLLLYAILTWVPISSSWISQSLGLRHMDTWY